MFLSKTAILRKFPVFFVDSLYHDDICIYHQDTISQTSSGSVSSFLAMKWVLKKAYVSYCLVFHSTICLPFMKIPNLGPLCSS